jgi:class 3 adenylate cyclase
MVCQKCKNNLPDNARFCSQCGTPVSTSTTTATIDPEQGRMDLLKEYIPPELASKIMQAGRKLESERRQVTVMFADVTGFTTLSEQIDPEMLSNLLNDCFKGLVSIIHKYEGTVDKFIGDAIMVIFGAPLAHENDPERAVRCATDMMEEIKRFNVVSQLNISTPVTLHVGLHSGIVVAGNVGSDLRMNYSVVGDTVNLSSRLAHLAPPGEIFMSATTHKSVANLAVVDGPYRLSVRGKSEPVVVYKLQAVKEILGHDAKRPSSKHFVGRDREVQKIETLVDFVKKQNGYNLFVKGEAGVGKSRLKDEIYRMALPRGITPKEGFCSGFEINTPYYLWNTLIRSILQIDFDTPENEVKGLIHQHFSQVGLRKELPYIAAIMGIRDDELLEEEGTVRKQKIFNALAKLLKHYTSKNRTIYILEDLHWIDKFSQELLYYLFSQQKSPPTLLVGFYRLEYTHAQSIETFGEVINLSRLNKDDSRKLIRGQLDVDFVPEQIESAILTRSEGNPFYLQEMIKTLLDKNIITINQREVKVLERDFESILPGTIQGIIMARIDNIQESIKSVLFSAAVIGREFSRPILEQVVDIKTDLDTNLDELQSLELILEKEEAQEFDYIFKHYLIQEVAYNTILLNKRKELHAGIANAIENLYVDRLHEFYEVLAFHFEKAEMWEKAAEYLGRSGNKAKQIYTKDESEEFFQRKEMAIQKIYESQSRKRTFWGTIKTLTPPLIAMLIPIIPIYMYVFFMGKNPFLLTGESLLLGIGVSLICIWYAITLWFLGVVPFLRGRPKLYDLLENQVRIIFEDGSSQDIEFQDIQAVRYLDVKIKKDRPLFRKIFDPFCRVATNKKLNLIIWLKDIVFNILPAYSFGINSNEGEIQLRRKKGSRTLRVFFPWLHSPRRSKDISLFPYDTWEFFEQFRIAFYSWKRQQEE